MKGTQVEVREEIQVFAMPETGFLRIGDILRFIPIKAPTWWKWVRTGKAPKGIKFGPNITVWRAEDIREFIKRLGGHEEV